MMESHCNSNTGTVGLLIVTSGAKDTVALQLFGITNRDRWMYVGRHCNILSQVNIAVNVELRNVTRIARTVDVWHDSTYRSDCGSISFPRINTF